MKQQSDYITPEKPEALFGRLNSDGTWEFYVVDPTQGYVFNPNAPRYVVRNGQFEEVKS